MKTMKKLLALFLGAMMLLGLLAGCGENTSAPTQTQPQNVGPLVPTLSGMLILNANASFKITYDQDGMVMEVSGADEEGSALATTYTDYAGKTCSAVVKELIAASAEATLLREAKSVVLKLAIGSQLPSETFLEGLANDAAEAVSENSATASVVAIGLDGLDEEGYINAEYAQALLKNYLGVTSFDSYNGDTSPRNDCYTVYVKTGEVESSYLIDAITGSVIESVEDEDSEPEFIEEEETFDPSFEEEVEETMDEEAAEPEDPAV